MIVLLGYYQHPKKQQQQQFQLQQSAQTTTLALIHLSNDRNQHDTQFISFIICFFPPSLFNRNDAIHGLIFP